MTDYLITGGAGFIGSNVAEYLVNQGMSVRILDNFSTGKHVNIESFAGKIEVIEGDLRVFESVKRAVHGVRYVLHIGAVPSVPLSVEEPLGTNDVNITGTLNVLLAARDEKVDRVVFSSSSSVYGDSPTLPKHEGMLPNPLSPYALQKLTGEFYCRMFWKLYGLPTVALRYFNVFGPRQNPQSQYAAVIPRFITSIVRNESPAIFGDGTQTRDFSYVTDVIEANLAACVAPQAAFGEAFNVACGGRLSLLDLVQTVNDIVGKQVKPRFESVRAGDIQHSQADIAKAQKILGWTPSVSFREGIERAVEWYSRTVKK